MPSFYISAAHKSSGKTTVSIGLAAAFHRQGMTVQCFKKGPDYIDPMWLRKASGQPCYNLDFHTMTHDEITRLYASHIRNADLGLIEGNKGLFDGVDIEGSDCNAALAKLLRLPVVLVLNCEGITRGLAPLVQGYLSFDPHVDIAGVILNRVAGERHEGKLRAVMEHYTDLPVLGAVRRKAELEIRERHLGLVPSNEAGDVEKRIKIFADIMTEQVDLHQIIQLSARADSTSFRYEESDDNPDQDVPLRVAVLRDSSFGFYYPDDLEAMERQGAELVMVNALEDRQLPAVDAIFIGGGFPETHASRLEANVELRRSIRAAIEAGMPAYAECGGLMYLSRSIRWQGQSHEMVGVIEADTVMTNRPVGRGYAQLQKLESAPWSATPQSSYAVIPAHEFHYSHLENMKLPQRYAYRVLRGTGIDGQYDGIVYKNLLASYIHLRDTNSYHWTRDFLRFVRDCKKTSKAS